MSIKMQVPAGHATALMGSYPQELRKAKAEVKKVTELMEVLRGIQWRMGAWVRGDYLLREFKEVCAADVLKLDEVLAARERGEFDMTCKVKDAVRLVHGVLICIAEARAKAKVSSMAESGDGYIIEACKLLKLRQLVQYSKVKTFRRANNNLSRCRLPACKLSRAEKERILVEYASHIKGDKTSVRVANSLTGKAGYDARARIQWYQIQPEMKRIMKHSALLTCTQNQEDKERLAVDVRVMANLGTPYAPEREQFLKLVALRSLLQFRQTSREQYTRPHGVRVVAPVRERMWSYLTWESIIDMNKELDFGQ